LKVKSARLIKQGQSSWGKIGGFIEEGRLGAARSGLKEKAKKKSGLLWKNEEAY